MEVERLWGGRFEDIPPREIISFLSGRDVKGMPASDERLIPYDLWGTRAHVLMLCHHGVLSRQDGKKILTGLRQIEKLHKDGKFILDVSKEDVHSNIESFLVEQIGIEYGGKVHTGRSRNDQIVLDMRLYLRDQVLGFIRGLVALMEALLQRAEEHRLTFMPGYTHHQHAVVTTFGYVLLSFCGALQRDAQRFFRWFDLFNENPLGAAAGYGTSFNLDRRLTSNLLGFDRPVENFIDPITQRWEPETELAYTATVMMNHLSSIAQTLILLSTSEFKMVRLDDRHCTGSSIMPQKRNPCSLEVIKAKASYAQGMLMSLVSVGKALFVGYNRDTQWTKYWIMDLVEESLPALPVLADVIRLLRVDEARMLKQGQEGFVGATLLMEWMVRQKSLPLRKAKMIVEKAVRYSEKEGAGKVSYESLGRALGEMKVDTQIIKEEVEEIQRPEGIAVFAKKEIRENLSFLRKRTKTTGDELIKKTRRIEKAKELIWKMEKKFG